MADEGHLAILKRGADFWNRWRQDNPEIRHPELQKADLMRADLFEANLEGANLIEADLFEAHLLAANLAWANLEGAVLVGTNLDEADLEGANLVGSYLEGAKLVHTNLAGANLAGALLGNTVLGNINLSKTRGLEKCVHDGPSHVDIRTLQSSGKLPVVFLRGCGFPDSVIDYLPSLLNDPIQFYSCFISYSSKDDAFARRLHADLQDNGVRCWFAPEDMKIGDKIRNRIDEVIRIHEKLLLVLSENSIDSEWVEKEVETAFERERETKETVLFPLRLDDAVMDTNTGWAADIKRSRNIGDFRNWKDHDAYQKGLERLLRDLKVEK